MSHNSLRVNYLIMGFLFAVIIAKMKYTDFTFTSIVSQLTILSFMVVATYLQERGR